MSEYDPAAENRGTCPYCERRCGVHVPRGGDGSARVCNWHKSPTRAIAFGSPRVCPGVGMECREDREAFKRRNR